MSRFKVVSPTVTCWSNEPHWALASNIPSRATPPFARFLLLGKICSGATQNAMGRPIIDEHVIDCDSNCATMRDASPDGARLCKPHATAHCHPSVGRSQPPRCAAVVVAAAAARRPVPPLLTARARRNRTPCRGGTRAVPCAAVAGSEVQERPLTAPATVSGRCDRHHGIRHPLVRWMPAISSTKNESVQRANATVRPDAYASHPCACHAEAQMSRPACPLHVASGGRPENSCALCCGSGDALRHRRRLHRCSLSPALEVACTALTAVPDHAAAEWIGCTAPAARSCLCRPDISTPATHPPHPLSHPPSEGVLRRCPCETGSSSCFFFYF